MIVELITSLIGFVFFMMLLEIIFFSSRDVVAKQKAFEGRMLFFIYSLLVYYKNLRFNIFIFDTFLNQPIVKAFDLLNSLFEGFFGLSIATSPWIIFAYLIPAGFVYNFVKYWVNFGFMDNQVAEMISLAALVIFISNAGKLGLISVADLITWTEGISSKFVGVSQIEFDASMVGGIPLIGSWAESLGNLVFSGSESLASGDFASLIVFLIVVLVLSLAAFFVGALLLRVYFDFFVNKEKKGKNVKSVQHFSQEREGFGQVIPLLFALAVTAGSLILVIGRLSGWTFLDPIFEAEGWIAFFLPPFFWLAALMGLAFVFEVMVYLAFFLVMKDVNAGTGGNLVK